ncbi:MAG: UvrB/UvrC motif-containing protein, partial [Patescibacteria group bacterium]
EANLIKKYQPRFNVMWKDDKSYFYVTFANPPADGEQKIPYVFVTHQPSYLQSVRSDTLQVKKNNMLTYIGPFVEGAALKKTLRFLRRVFPYYTTKKHPKNKCTYCHLDLCPGPYLNLPEYKKNIKKLVLILKGKRSAVLTSLKKEMKQVSKKQNFEKAGKLRDKIYNLQQIMSHTHVINQEISHRKNHAIAYFLRQLGIKKEACRIECYDISNIQGKAATGSVVVFTNGAPDKNEYRKFKIRLPEKPNDIAMLKEILQRRFTHPEWKYPEAILIDGGKAQLNIAIKIKNEVKKESLTLSLRSYSQGQSFKNIKNIKIMAFAKGRQELFIEGREKPIPLKQLPQEVYNLIKWLDDEAHRFAITYHKKLRKKNLLM